jgi:hypothetical protein
MNSRGERIKQKAIQSMKRGRETNASTDSKENKRSERRDVPEESMFFKSEAEGAEFPPRRASR